jgi:hypothetical protein
MKAIFWLVSKGFLPNAFIRKLLLLLNTHTEASRRSIELAITYVSMALIRSAGRVADDPRETIMEMRSSS